LSIIVRKIKDITRFDKWPTKYQWSQFLKILTKREQFIAIAITTIIIASILGIAVTYYDRNSVVIPSKGGSYREGILGTVRYLNPVLSSTNEAERDINRLIYSGLLKYDSKGELTTDLAEKYDILDEGKTYEFTLKKDLIWQDKKPLTVDDIIYTIKIIQDTEYRSPERKNWEGITIEKIDDLNIRFRLKNSYAGFLQKFTLGIIPKHLWKKIKPENFALTDLNFKPIGSGSYQFSKLEKTPSGNLKSITLEASKHYYVDDANISVIVLKIYQTNDALLTALKGNEIDGASRLSALDAPKLKNSLEIYKIKLPRYFAIFFNEEQNKLLANKSLRQAMAHAINREEIIQKILMGYGELVNSPVPETIFGDIDSEVVYEYSKDKAINLLEEAGWKDLNEEGFRFKTVKVDKNTTEDQILELSLTTIESSELQQVAEFIKKAWNEIGIKIDIQTINPGSIQSDVIKPRQYQALLYGQVLSLTPDPFSFWHSSQKRDPGLNLSLYDNKIVDTVLTDLRQDLNPDTRKDKLAQIAKTITEDEPAIFLYSPDYLHPVSKLIKGIDTNVLSLPSERFGQLENWYINTSRKLK